MRTDGYVVVQPWMVTDYNLKGNKLLIYALIWGFSQDEQSCFYGSTRYITDYFKLSERAVVGILDALKECKEIQLDEIGRASCRERV